MHLPSRVSLNVMKSNSALDVAALEKALENENPTSAHTIGTDNGTSA